MIECDSCSAVGRSSLAAFDSALDDSLAGTGSVLSSVVGRDELAAGPGSPSGLSEPNYAVREQHAAALLDGPQSIQVYQSSNPNAWLASFFDYGAGSSAQSLRLTALPPDPTGEPPSFGRVGDKAEANAIANFRLAERSAIENILLQTFARAISGFQSALRRLTQG